MCGNNPTQIIQKNQFSLDTGEAKRESLDGEINNWDPDEDRTPDTNWDESPDPQINSQMVPDSSHKSEDEPIFTIFK